MPKTDSKPTLHDAVQVEQFRREFRLDPDPLRRMRYALYQSFESTESALERLPAETRHAVRERFNLEPLKVVQRLDSELDPSTKFVMEGGNGGRFETVLLKTHSRTAVCVSTQIGCQAGCVFCATARMGLLRNLSPPEIIEQLLIAGREAKSRGDRLRNVVFMGMGEPLHNEEALYESIRWIVDPHGLNWPARRITVSTVGVPDAMRRLVAEFPGIQIAFSLHSARPEVRGKLVPWSKNYTWDEIRETLKDIALLPRLHRHQGPVMIEYVMIAGVNDSLDDARLLIEYLQGIPCIVNLIPYNPISFAPKWECTARPDRDSFATLLRDEGIFTTIRYSMGSDVQAACGQLLQRDQRAI